MSEISFEEIISILAMHGRPDLIADFKDMLGDPDYEQVIEDSSTDEDDNCEMEDVKAVVDDEGFHKLI